MLGKKDVDIKTQKAILTTNSLSSESCNNSYNIDDNDDAERKESEVSSSGDLSEATRGGLCGSGLHWHVHSQHVSGVVSASGAGPGAGEHQNPGTDHSPMEA